MARIFDLDDNNQCFLRLTRQEKKALGFWTIVLSLFSISRWYSSDGRNRGMMDWDVAEHLRTHWKFLFAFLRGICCGHSKALGDKVSNMSQVV